MPITFHDVIPQSHATNHADGGSDEVNAEKLAGVPQGGYQNLIVGTTSVAAISVTADELWIEGTRFPSFSKTGNITASGAGGLDTGAEAASTWYYIWAIAKADGTTALLFSTSATSPSMPTGYTKKRRIGAVYNNASSNFKQGVQEGNFWTYLDAITDCRILTSGQATTFTDVDASSAIPPTARRGLFRVTSGADHDTAEIAFGGRVRENGTSSGAATIVVPTYSQVANIFIALTHVAPCQVDSAQLLEYKIDAVPTTSGGVSIDVEGYFDRI